MAVIDASVYISLVNAHEIHHADSWAWFQQAIDYDEIIVAPVILLAEVAAGLSRGTRNVELAHNVVQQLLDGDLIKLYPITQNLAEQAAKISADHKIRGCDAIYVALAESLEDYLVTLDNQQLNRGASVVTTRKP